MSENDFECFASTRVNASLARPKRLSDGLASRVEIQAVMVCDSRVSLT